MSMFRKIFKPSDEKGREREDIKNIEYKRKIDPSFRDPCGKGHLHILLEHGYDVPEDLEYVLSCGCEINTGDSNHDYPIHIAVRRALNKCVKKLIQRNSLLDVFNNDDVTPLMIAARSGHADNLFNLLQNGANPNLANKSKRSAMHFVAIGGELRCLKLLLEARGKVNHQDKDGYSPIILAAKHGHVSIVKSLLAYTTFPKTNPNKQDNYDRTALHWAVEEGHVEIVRLLLDHKVDTDLTAKCGETAFSNALRFNRPAIMGMLLEHGCDRGFMDHDNGTSLGLAALHGYDQCLQVLIDHGESPDDVAYFGITPLMAAVFESRVNATCILLKGGASVDMIGRIGVHALPLAFFSLCPRNEHARHTIVKQLLRHGSHPNKKLNAKGPMVMQLAGLSGGRYDMLSFAMVSGYLSFVRMLLIAGSPVAKKDIDELSSNSFITRGFYVSQEILDTLRNWTNNPLSLKHLTRLCIRKSLGYNTEAKLEQLPMAKPLKIYLNLVELDFINVERTSNRQPIFSASNFVSITPCGHAGLYGSLLHDTVQPTLSACRCEICTRYEQNMSMP